MQYKGFVANYQYIRDLGLFVAQVYIQQDTISFSAPTLHQLEITMAQAVEDYLSTKSSVPLIENLLTPENV